MNARRHRILLGSAIVLLVVVVCAFGAALLHNRSVERDQAHRRFADEATVTAAMTRSIFASSAPDSALQLSTMFATPHVSPAAISRRAAQDKVAYAAVLDAQGRPLATTQPFPDSVRRRLASPPDYLRRVVAGREPYRLSGFVGPSTLEYAISFPTPAGRRIFVEGFSAQLVAALLNGYLAQLPNARHQDAYIVDAGGRVITGAGAVLGRPVPRSGSHRTTVQAPIGGSEWRVVLSQPTSDLYRGISAGLLWLVLAAIALAGTTVIALLVLALRRDDDLARSSAELARMNTELLRSNSELAEFASVASHDLQEPLRKVVGFGTHLERRHAHELSGDARESLHRMSAAAERMSVLVDDLLRLSRVTSHAETPERVELTETAEDVLSDLSELVSDTHGHVQIDHLPAVLADPLQMRQLLQNLIANGLKFHRPEVAPEVHVQAFGNGFAVSDNGIGFEPDHAERIFGVFERLHPRDVYDGTGIGLALCRKIVERHGGTITATGTPGEGSVFRVEFPATVVSAGREVVHA